MGGFWKRVQNQGTYQMILWSFIIPMDGSHQGEQSSLPSTLAPGEVKHLSPKQIGEISLCFYTDVHNKNMQQTTSWAWDNIHKLDTEA